MFATGARDRPFPARALRLHRVHRVLTVLAGELRDQLQDLHPGLQLTTAQHPDLVEEVTLGEVRQLCRHGSIQAPTTDNTGCQNPLCGREFSVVPAATAS